METKAIDFDPSELTYNIDNRTKTNNVVSHLARVAGTDVWVCYETWRTGPSESDYRVHGVGKLSVDAIELDAEEVREGIIAEVEDLRDHAQSDFEPDHILALADSIEAHAEELAAEAVDSWEFGVPEVVSDHVYEGYAGVDGTLVWVGHVEEAFYHEANDAVSAVARKSDFADTDYIARDIVQSALFVAVSSHTDRWRNPHAEYIGHAHFEDVDPSEIPVDAE